MSVFVYIRWNIKSHLPSIEAILAQILAIILQNVWLYVLHWREEHYNSQGSLSVSPIKTKGIAINIIRLNTKSFTESSMIRGLGPVYFVSGISSLQALFRLT